MRYNTEHGPELFPSPSEIDTGRRGHKKDAVVEVRDLGRPKEFVGDEQGLTRKVSSWTSWLAKGASTRNLNTTQGDWKPWTLRLPVLGSFVAVSLGLIAALELLNYQSSGANAGGLIFAPSINDIPLYGTFLYLYLPTVISVIYSMIWGWVDLDAKRLEPWFQLSEPEGATAENSLLLQYPFDFLAFVPVTAAKRKHWSVFYAGSVMMIIFWVITPIQSAIFSTDQVVRKSEFQMSRTSLLMPLREQSSALNSNFLNTVYGVLWLSQPLPEFSTKRLWIEPMKPIADESAKPLNEESWSVNTTAYSTELSCTEANVTKNMVRFTYNFDDNNGCYVPSIELPSANSINASYMVLYAGYYSDSLGIQSQISLANENCSIEHSHKFLAIWASAESQGKDPSFPVGTSLYTNLTAVFCQPKYQIQTVYATINASDHSIINVDQGNTPPVNLPESSFNATHFEYIMGTGAPSVSESRNLLENSVVRQYPRLLKYKLAYPISNMVGFAFGTGLETAETLHDPVELKKVFEQAHQVLFSIAMSILFVPTTSSQALVDAIRTDVPAAIIFVREFSIVVEAAIGTVIILAAALWYHTNRRQSNLNRDPASISDIVALVGDSGNFLEDFKDNGTVTAEVLRNRVHNNRYRLSASVSEGDIIEKLEKLTSSTETCLDVTRQHSIPAVKYKRAFQAVRPKELNIEVGAGLLALVAGAICTTCVLFYKINVESGLRRPTDNTLVLSILENLLPIAFASLLEPFWVVLNRFLCLLQPFEDLRDGSALSRNSIAAKYTSLPPQLVIWRALRAKHLLLTAVCTTSILFNVLSVSLGGLFMENALSTTTDMDSFSPLEQVFTEVKMANFSNNAVQLYYYDHFYVALANKTTGTSLPAWVDQERFYMPFSLEPAGRAASSLGLDTVYSHFDGKTRAFGASVSCQSLTSELVDGVSVYVATDQNYTSLHLWTNHLRSNGSITTCNTASGRVFGNTVSVFLDEAPADASTLEISSQLRSTIQSDEERFCSTKSLTGWIRLGAPGSNTTNTNASTTSSRSLESSFVLCSPSIISAEYNVTVDPAGHILSSRQVSVTESDTSKYFAAGTSKYLVDEMIDLSTGTTELQQFKSKWHTDGRSRDWANALLQVYLPSVDLLEPRTAAPNATVLVPLMEDLQTRLFAILLGLNDHVFQPAGSLNQPLVMHGSQVETRIFMSIVMFFTTVILLTLILIVATWYYSCRPKRFLPRMPTSIGSILAYVAASHVSAHLEEQNYVGKECQTYSYGWFIGTDNRCHVGIDVSENVTPLLDEHIQARKLRWRRRS